MSKEKLLQIIIEGSYREVHLTKEGTIGFAGIRDESIKRIFGQKECKSNGGAYFLIGWDDQKLKNQIYVGETKNFRNRISNHLHKDFWNQVVFFTSTEVLEKTQLQYLEWKILQELKKSNQVILKNDQIPPNPPILSKFSKKTTNRYKEDIDLILGLFGFLNLRKKKKKEFSIIDDFTFFIKRKNQIATMRPNLPQYTVLVGSEIEKVRYEKRLSGVLVKQEMLINSGDLVKSKTKDKWILKKTISFSSPSGASEFVLGITSNGRKDWVTKDKKSYADVESELLEQPKQLRT